VAPILVAGFSRERMGTLHSSLYAVAITSCLLCTFVASTGAREVPQRNYRFLIVYLILESLGFAFEWLMAHPTSPGKSLWLGLLMAISFLVAPCLWLFAREITEGETPSVRSLSKGELVVIATGVILTLPLIQRAYWGPHFGDPDDPASPTHLLLIQGAMLACAVLFLGQVPYYLRACVRILEEHTKQSKALFSNIESRSLNILRVLVFVVGANWFASLLRVLHCLLLGKDTGFAIYFALIEVVVTVVAVLLLMQRTTSFTVDDRRLARELVAPEVEDANAEVKYAKSRLDQPARTRIQRKLQESLIGSRLHRNNELTLRRLCEQIRENPHYVSQVINQDLGTSFYDLINRYRIEDAKNALVSSPDKTVLEIALEAGFNSKSTFNAAFRQHAGSTPTEYRREKRLAVSG
jgi:AraC-like DNA-binding protein